MSSPVQTASLARAEQDAFSALATDHAAARLARRVKHHLPHALRISEHACTPLPECGQLQHGCLALSPNGQHAAVTTAFPESETVLEARLRIDVWSLPGLQRVARIEDARAGGAYHNALHGGQSYQVRWVGWLDDDRIAFAARGLLVTYDIRTGARQELRLGDHLEHFSASSSTLAVSLFSPQDGSPARYPHALGVQLLPIGDVIAGRVGRDARSLGYQAFGGSPYFIALDASRNTFMGVGTHYRDKTFIERVFRVDLTTNRSRELLTRSGPSTRYLIALDSVSGRTAVSDEHAIALFDAEGMIVRTFAREANERSNVCLARGGELVIECGRGVTRAWSTDGHRQGEAALREIGRISRVWPVPGKDELLAISVLDSRYELVRIEARTLQLLASSVSSPGPVLQLARHAVDADEQTLWIGDHTGRVHVHTGDAEPVQTLATARGPIYEIRRMRAERRTGISSSAHALLWLDDNSQELAVQRAVDGTAVENGSSPARIQATPRGHFRIVDSRDHQRVWVAENEFYTLYAPWRQVRVWRDSDKNDWLGLPDHQCAAYLQLSENAVSITSFGGDVMLLLAEGDLVALTPGRFPLPPLSKESVPWPLTGDGARRHRSGVVSPLGANGSDELGRIFVWSATELVALARAAGGNLARVAAADVTGVRRVIGTTGHFGLVVVHDDRVSFRSVDTLEERFSLRTLADGTCLWHVPHPSSAEPHPGFYWRRGGARDLPSGLFEVLDPEGNLVESDIAAPFIERAFQRRHVRLALTDYAAFLRVMGAAEHALPTANSVPLLSAAFY